MEQKSAHGIGRGNSSYIFDEDQLACLREGFRSPTFNLVQNFVKKTLESNTFGVAKENGKAKIYGGGRVGVEGEDIEDRGRDGMSSIFPKYNGRFEGID